MEEIRAVRLQIDTFTRSVSCDEDSERLLIGRSIESTLNLRPRVVITGIGPITAVGTGVEPFWEGLKRERSPIRRLTAFDASIWRSRLAAEGARFSPPPAQPGNALLQIHRIQLPRDCRTLALEVSASGRAMTPADS